MNTDSLLQQQSRSESGSVTSSSDHAAETGSFQDRRSGDDHTAFDMRSGQQGIERMSSNGGSYGTSSSTHDYLGYTNHGQNHEPSRQWDDEDSNMFDGL